MGNPRFQVLLPQEVAANPVEDGQRKAPSQSDVHFEAGLLNKAMFGQHAVIRPYWTRSFFTITTIRESPRHPFPSSFAFPPTYLLESTGFAYDFSANALTTPFPLPPRETMILMHNNSSGAPLRSAANFYRTAPTGSMTKFPPPSVDDDAEPAKNPLHVRFANHRIVKRTTTFLTRHMSLVVPSTADTNADTASTKPPRHGRQRSSAANGPTRDPSKRGSRHPAPSPSSSRTTKNGASAEPVRLDVATPSKKWRDFLSVDEFRELGLTPNEATYQEIVFEIVRTEADYLRDLKMVHKIFIKTAKEYNIPIPKNINMLFCNIVDMIILHQPILRVLESRKTKYWPVIPSVTDIFMDNIFGFNIYSSYLVNFDAGIRTIEEALQIDSDPFGVFLKQQIARPEFRNLTLQGFLLKPVQRLTKYPLFFKNLIECRSADHPDFWQTTELLRQMDGSIRRMQEEKRNREDLFRLQQLERRIKGLQIYPEFKLAIPGRELVLEGPLILFSPSLPKVSTSSASSSTNSLPSTNSLSSTLNVNIVPLPSSSAPLPSTAASEPLFAASQKETSTTSQATQLYVFLFNDVILWTRQTKGGRTPGYKLVEPPAKVTHVLDMAGEPNAILPTVAASILSSGAEDLDNVNPSSASTYAPSPSSPASTMSVASSYFTARPPSSLFAPPLPRPPHTRPATVRTASSRSSTIRTGAAAVPLNPQAIFECTSVHRHCVTFQLQAPSEDLKREWVARLRDSIRTHTNRREEDGVDKFWALRGLREEHQMLKRMSLDEGGVKGLLTARADGAGRESEDGFADIRVVRPRPYEGWSTVGNMRESPVEWREQEPIPETQWVENAEMEVEVEVDVGEEIRDTIAAVSDAIALETRASGGGITLQSDDVEMGDIDVV